MKCNYGGSENSIPDKKDLYFCVVCDRHLPIIDGVVIHDDIEHPEKMVFEPQAEKTHSH